MAEAPFQPINQFVIVQCKAPGERKSAGGIVLTGSVLGYFVEAKVLAVSERVEIEGTDKVRRPRVRPGQKVVVMCTAPPALPGLACTTGNEEVRLIQETEIVGLVVDDG